jgi:hypothetical protein
MCPTPHLEDHHDIPCHDLDETAVYNNRIIGLKLGNDEKTGTWVENWARDLDSKERQYLSEK